RCTVRGFLLLLRSQFYRRRVRSFPEGAGFGQLLIYAGITMLGCVGYGAFFVVVGLFVRNPIIPAVLLYLWEWINFLLPPLLKKISVIHYLNSLMPVPLSEGPFAVVAEPTPAWIAIPSMLGVTLIVLILAAYRIRHMEIRYGSDLIPLTPLLAYRRQSSLVPRSCRHRLRTTVRSGRTSK